jgi:hypothetical protein
MCLFEAAYDEDALRLNDEAGLPYDHVVEALDLTPLKWEPVLIRGWTIYPDGRSWRELNSPFCRLLHNTSERNRRSELVPFYVVLGSVFAISVLSGGAAIALVISQGRLDACRRRVVDRLTQIAFIGAAGIVALLYAFFPG